MYWKLPIKPSEIETSRDDEAGVGNSSMPVLYRGSSKHRGNSAPTPCGLKQPKLFAAEFEHQEPTTN